MRGFCHKLRRRGKLGREILPHKLGEKEGGGEGAPPQIGGKQSGEGGEKVAGGTLRPAQVIWGERGGRGRALSGAHITSSP